MMWATRKAAKGSRMPVAQPGDLSPVWRTARKTDFCPQMGGKLGGRGDLCFFHFSALPELSFPPVFSHNLVHPLLITLHRSPLLP